MCYVRAAGTTCFKDSWNLRQASTSLQVWHGTKMKTIHFGEETFGFQWQAGIAKIRQATPMYSPGVRAFEHEVCSSRLVQDDSFVVLSDSGEVVALVPLYCFKDEDGVLEYRYPGEYLRPPLIDGPPESNSSKKVQKFSFEHIEDLAKQNQVKTHKAMIESVELLEGRHYYNYLMDFGYDDESTICQLINVSKSEEALWLDVRKSYRPLINRAQANHDGELMTSDNFDLRKCDDYRSLHFKAAGRQTRSLKSFHLQYDLVRDGQGFLMFVRTKSGQAVAAHFFYRLGIYCLYASSAIDNDIPPNAGIGHFGLWQGIMAARNLCCKYVDMGQLRLSANPSEKEQNIALFKKGFGGQTVTVFRGTKIFQ